MVIPDNLLPLVRELAAANFIHAHNQAGLLDRMVSAEHKDAIEAHRLLDQARELNELVNPPAAAEEAA